MKTSDFDYTLPQELVAQTPCEPRDHSRLLVLNRSDASIQHRRFFDILDYVHEGDVLVFNDSRVIPARLAGRRVDSGGKVEILLLRRLKNNTWEALVKPGKQLIAGRQVEISSSNHGKVIAEVIEARDDGLRIVRFSDEKLLPDLGKMPLPPYIHTPLANPERYQTVYSRIEGSAAAPTAGLHLTNELLDKIKDKGVRCLFVTLHIGLDTFRPVTEADPLKHTIHREFGVISQSVADELSLAKRQGRRIIAVGTTSVRTLEYAAQVSSAGGFQPLQDWVDLFILPGYKFRMVDAMVTNFHLPHSTLLMLVTAFAGKDALDKAYREAIAEKYRFYSFGDAMLVL
ncbi:MAG: tRNA preQ1(34) S-adenosylmethionine ribosyltransferase-isomerase QueA [Dehalococcoidales bacterium]|nr:tRNA preQ1(34) S-adenosylmethionine ribosyltransferase-isomerase QueA [Dehalococcoidales bacterium]